MPGTLAVAFNCASPSGVPKMMGAGAAGPASRAGAPPSGGRWRVAIRGPDEVWELAPGEAVATSTARPGRSPVDPRTGRVVTPPAPSATVRAATCAEADARAVATLVGLGP